ncbi:UNVERIFIED_CONTAM: putative late blight resistance proteinR1A-10 [Sesamum angustifolium]|uniref:Late blight resistance proteinR1A-10 n=1 Tax=Sesamum angustifolium TaxID=2727405 RepID=A0AAW2J1A7_9LAMI
MGAFPEDYEIRVSKLVKLWMAEGFMKPSVSKSFEEGAEEYLDDLVKRSLVLVTRTKSTGKIKSCSVHDLVRDLCIRKAREEKFLLYATDRDVKRVLPKPIKDQHHLSIPYASPILFHNIYNPTIRTALFQHCVLFPSSLKGFRLLRVLDALTVTFMKFPVDVLELFHLRSFALENLQTLALLLNFKCSKRIGQIFPSLKTLSLIYEKLDRVLNWKLYGLHNLIHLHQLEKLKISMCIDDGESRVPLWEKLAFPMMLKKLTLDGFMLSQQDMATIGSLPNLHVLKLRRCSCGDCKWETTEGEFAQLKFLKIERTNLKHWVTEESSHFPSLERLLLDCGELREIPDVIGENPTLELIEVTETRWNKSLVDSAKCIKEKQKDYGNDNLQVQIREY